MRQRTKFLMLEDTHLSAFVRRPFPPHFLHGAGYILRPGWTSCLIVGKPVPLQASQLISISREPFHRSAPEQGL
jgi:hypothetical protein